jgi:N-sulfoglucosamine sulfohydrolase
MHQEKNNLIKMMKIVTYKIIVFALLFITAISSAQQKKESLKPNILFILSEDMSTDLECYGMPAVKTPVLNSLAATGIQYMNAYGNNSICSPSRSNMITGVHH